MTFIPCANFILQARNTAEAWLLNHVLVNLDVCVLQYGILCKFYTASDKDCWSLGAWLVNLDVYGYKKRSKRREKREVTWSDIAWPLVCCWVSCALTRQVQWYWCFTSEHCYVSMRSIWSYTCVRMEFYLRSSQGFGFHCQQCTWPCDEGGVRKGLCSSVTWVV